MRNVLIFGERLLYSSPQLPKAKFGTLEQTHNKRLRAIFEISSPTQPFNGPLSGTTLMRRYQKVKTNMDFTEARDSEWQWHQLGHMQVCTSLQTDNHASTPQLKFFTGRMPFLPPNQQRQSTEGVNFVPLNRIKYRCMRFMQFWR